MPAVTGWLFIYSFIRPFACSLACPLRGGNIPAVELQRGLQRDLCGDVAGVQRGGVFFFGFVERVDVCLVVLRVVELSLQVSLFSPLFSFPLPRDMANNDTNLHDSG